MKHLNKHNTKTTTKPKVTLKQAFKTIIWPRRNLVLLGLILIIIRSLSGFVLPIQSKILLDEVVPNNDYSLLSSLILIVIISIIVQAVSSFLLTKVLSIQAQYLISELRAQVQKKVLSLPISFFDNTKSGVLVSRIMSDVEGVRNLIGTGLVQLVGGSFTAILTLIILLKMNIWMTLFTFIPLSVFAMIALRAFKYIRPIFRARGKINADVKGRLTETLSGVRVIKAFNAESQETEIFARGVDAIFQNVKKSLTATAIMTSSSTFLIGLATTGIMGIGGHFMIKGEITPGDFLQFTFLLAFMVAQLTEALAGLDRTEELMSMEAEHDDPNRIIELKDLKGELVFSDVSFGYVKNQNVLHNIDFKATCGSVIALVGSSGSGKSTIAGLSATFLNPQSGIITIDGEDISKVKLHSYRKHLGVVLQDEFLFEGTIRENIIFPRPEANEVQVNAAVKAAYVDEFTDRFDDGLETLIGERGVKLSGGQRQRIAIARAILANPKIIILDEATSNLDTESEALIQKSLDELTKNRTTIVIAHRLSTIRKADQILVIENGHIVERGNHDDLITNEGRYYDLFTYQAKI